MGGHKGRLVGIRAWLRGTDSNRRPSGYEPDELPLLHPARGIYRSIGDPVKRSARGQDRVVSASREIAAPAAHIFELIADPSRQPEWDGNDNLGHAPSGQRVRAVGDVFTMVLTKGSVRENHVVEFEEGRRIAWRPAPVGEAPPGQLWRWTLEPLDEASTRVTHTYDWTELTDESRLPRARATTSALYSSRGLRSRPAVSHTRLSWPAMADNRPQSFVAV